MTTKTEDRLFQLFLYYISSPLTPEVALRKAKESLNYYEGQISHSKASKSQSGTITLEERLATFREECRGYRDEYTESTINDFYLYWSEPNKSRTKMRFEQESTFEVSRRLRTWAKMSEQRGGSPYKESTKTVDEEYLKFKKEQQA